MVLCKVFLCVLFVSHVCFGGMEEEEGVKYANKCEGKYIVTNPIKWLQGWFRNRLNESWNVR